MRTNRPVVRALATAAAATAAILTLTQPALADGGAAPIELASDGDGSVQVAALVQPSVVYETVTWSGYVYDRYNHQYLKDKPFTVTMQCTGFVVNPDGYVATAGHCVDPSGGKDAVRRQAAAWALQNYYDIPGALTVEDVLGDYRVDILGEDDQVHHNQATRAVNVSWSASVSGVQVQKHKPARVLAFQEYDEGDGALLKVDETDLNAIELADTSDVEINSGVIAIGYPAIIDSFTDPDLTPTFDPGTVSSVKTVSHGLLSVFQLSAELSGGMSGGPTVDGEGRVIGVNSAHFVGEPFNYAVPAERIQELLGSAGVDNTVSGTTQTYRDSIRAYFAGDREAAVAGLEKVLDEQPANGLAKAYLDKAEDLPAAPSESSGSSAGWALWAAVAGGVVVAIVGGLLALLALVRRARRTRRGSEASYPAPPAVPVSPAVSPVPTGFGPMPSAPASRQGGAPVAVATLHCTACGQEVPAGAVFCGVCGTRRAPLG